MSTLELKHVNKFYDENQIIFDFNAEIEPGEMIVVVGPSGCGKSTLLRLIAGLEEITSGEVLINDELVNNKEPKDRNIAMVFQNYALYPHMTVYNNMAYGLRMRKFNKTEIKKRVHEVAELLGLTDYLQRKPQALSGGQRQRVAMGRAIVRKPALFLFDEPLSNLDAKLRHQMRIDIKRLQQELNITSLYVTHDQVEAMTLADRMIVLHEGKLQQFAKPMDIYQQPANQFVGGFIGSPAMNFLPACIENNTLVLSDTCSLPLSEVPKGYEHKELIIGIRPESMQLVNDTSNNCLTMTVDLVEQLGADTLLYGQYKKDGFLTVKTSVQTGMTIGKQVYISIHPNQLHLFNIKTQSRLG